MADALPWWRDPTVVGPPAASPQAAPTPPDSADAPWWRDPSVVGADAAKPAPVQPYTSRILPLSKDAQGHIHFDSNAGILGSIKRAVTLPGDVYSGKMDPNSDEGIARALDLAGLASPVNPAIRAGGLPGSLFSIDKDAVPVPTADELHAAADAGYTQARNLGVDYASPAVADMATRLRSQLEQDGILDTLAPKTFSVLGKLQSPPDGSVVPLVGIEAARRAFRNAGKDFTNPTDQTAASRAINGLDDFLSQPDPAAVVAGPAGEAAQLVQEARGNYAAGMRSDKLAGIEDRATLNAGVANSGLNLDNAIRQRARDILVRPKEAAGYSPEELDALRDVAMGNPTRNAVRFVGNLLGGGGGLGSVVTGLAGSAAGGAAGGTMGAVAGAALPLVGMASKVTGNALAKRAMDAADELVRQRSPLFEQRLAEAPPSVPSMAPVQIGTAGLNSGAVASMPPGFQMNLQNAQNGQSNLPDRSQFGPMVNASHRIASVLSSVIGKDAANTYATELARTAISKGVGPDEFTAALRQAGVKDGMIQRALSMAVKGGLVSGQGGSEAP